MISASARCGCTTKVGPKAGASAGMCSARIISIMCAIRGGASPNTPAISITSRRKSVGHPRTTSRRIPFTSGVRTCRANSRSTTKAARAELDASVARHGRDTSRPFRFRRECEAVRVWSFNDNFDLVARLQLVLLSEAVERPESFERVVGRCHAVCEFLDSIVWSDGHDFQTKRPDLLTLLQSHAAKAHDRFAKREIDLRRPRFGGEDETVNLAAEAHG